MSRIVLPTREELLKLAHIRADICVSIYIETSPIAFEKDVCRIEASNMVREAIGQLEDEVSALSVEKKRLVQMRDTLHRITRADDFCLNQANSMALLVTPDAYFTYHLANHLQNQLEIADRFYLKPLYRALTFEHRAYVLALSENQARVVELYPDSPAEEIHIPKLPASATDAVGLSSLGVGSSPEKDESTLKKVRLGQYIRQVNDALRPVMAGNSAPLILAATEPLSSMFKDQATVKLADEIIATNADHLSVYELTQLARPVLDRYYAKELEDLRKLFEERAGQSRVATDLGDVARAATYGMIDLALVDFDYFVEGSIDDSGNITRTEGVTAYGLIDEIVKRAMESGARIIAVRKDDMVGQTGVAAILRYNF